MTTWVDNSKIARLNPRTSHQAVAWGLGEITHPHEASYHNECSHFAGRCYGWGHSGADANHLAYQQPSGTRHTSGFTSAPAGALLFWDIGYFDHVALSVGDGYCVSNDILRDGKIDKVPIATIQARWGARPKWWTPAYFPAASAPVGPGVREPAPGTSAPAPVATISLAVVVYAARHDPARPATKPTYPWAVGYVERALAKLGYLAPKYVDGSYGTMTIAAYKRWQAAIGERQTGIPTLASLTKLGARSGLFKVKA